GGIPIPPRCPGSGNVRGSIRPWLPLPKRLDGRGRGRRVGQRRGGRTRAAGGTTLFRVGRYRRFCNIVKTSLSTKFVDFGRSAAGQVPPAGWDADVALEAGDEASARGPGTGEEISQFRPYGQAGDNVKQILPVSK